jgi:hypothetical protein
MCFRIISASAHACSELMSFSRTNQKAFNFVDSVFSTSNICDHCVSVVMKGLDVTSKWC